MITRRAVLWGSVGALGGCRQLGKAPPADTLVNGSLTAIRGEFNLFQNYRRLLVLLSPT